MTVLHLQAADHAIRAIPPVWPLASSVAVNPYLGQADKTLAETGALLARVSGLPMTMPRDWYAAKIADGTINDADIADALASAPENLRLADAAAVRTAVVRPVVAIEALPTVAALAANVTGVDWPSIISYRFGVWAAGYFDEGQALWAAPKGRNAYAAWREVAIHDLTPEIAGLKGFAQHVVDAPDNAPDAIKRAVTTLGLPEAAWPTFFHAQLASLGGWSQVARYKLWQAELAETTDTTALEFLAIRLVWAEALYLHAKDSIEASWREAAAHYAEPVEPTADLVLDQVLQEAAERATQRGLANMFASPTPQATQGRKTLQAAFCIDVRSEIFRRALEAVNPAIETIGFAGFFGITASHKGFASDVQEHRLPVLLNAGLHSVSGSDGDAEKDQATRFSKRASRAWGRFKLAAVSSFAFVEAMGPVYVGKLVRDALGLVKKDAPNEPAPRLDPSLSVDDMVGAAGTVLRAMSLTDGFAKIVVLAGHGASVTNNPHASGLHCGACGGYSGEVNARLLAAVLNHADVRKGLVEKGITIPEDTLFLAALHDTTTDAMTLYEADQSVSRHTKELATIKGWFDAAGKATRSERALRLPRADNASQIAHRSQDWAETRPEWALAGCKAFIAAPRSRTAGKSLEGRAFLHTYDWKQDEPNGFGVLELIMTAPVVVASWISLQYYGSSVAPQAFGGGNKIIHNVVGGIGVVEGNGGALCPGLPWQSVHDGEKMVHDPLRLSVCIEAPTEAMSDILSRHQGVRDLFDNKWLHLFALDSDGKMAMRYAGDLKWEPMPQIEQQALAA
ncbi:MAG: YbcC family protein [Devosiaceae bacterium]